MPRATAGQSENDQVDATVTLHDIKQRGCNILLAGSSSVTPGVCHRLLGDNDAHPPRHRIFVRTTPNATEPSPANNGTVHVIEQPRDNRGTATPQSPTAVTQARDIGVSTLDSQNLADLGIETSHVINTIKADVDDVAPAQLRLCFHSLDPLLTDHDTKTVFRFLHILGGRIRNTNGMAHYHLELPRDDPLVQTLAPLFDIIVEQRPENKRVYHRWTLVDEDVTTDWMLL